MYSISFVNLQAGFLMVYGSGKDVVILNDSGSIKAVLRGHKHEICAVCFESKNLHIISCDIEGFFYFWHFQESIWQNTRIERIKKTISCITWYSSRRLIAISSDSGLEISGVTDFGTKSRKIIKNSEFCVFNNDGTLLASHNRGRALSIVHTSNNKYNYQTVLHPDNISSFDFCPSSSSFITIDNDGVMRIWIEGIQSTFFCASVMRTNLIGSFIRPPYILNYEKNCSSINTFSIGFYDNVGEPFSISIDNNGKVLTSNYSDLFLKYQDDSLSLGFYRYKASFMTNKGVTYIGIAQNSINLFRNSLLTLPFHNSDIVFSQFSPSSTKYITLDSNGVLILWPLFNPYDEIKIISTNVSNAIWYDKDRVLFCARNCLIEYNTIKKGSEQIEFPVFSNCQGLYAIDEEIFIYSKNSILSKFKSIEVGFFANYTVSPVYCKKSIIALYNTDRIRLIALPDMIDIGSIEHDISITQISFISFSSFVVLCGNTFEIWEFFGKSYEMANNFQIDHTNGICSYASEFGGRLFSFDENRAYLIENSIIPFIDLEKIIRINCSAFGDIVVQCYDSFHSFPSWSVPHDSLFVENGTKVQTNLKEVTLNVGKLTEDSKFLLGLSSIIKHNILLPVSKYMKHDHELSLIVENTFAHLFEFTNINNYENIIPVQIPAIPGQYTSPQGLKLPIKCSSITTNLFNIVKDIREDVDMYGLRYLSSVRESNWPPSHMALYFAFSASQSQIIHHLSSFINTNSLSTFYVAACVHSHSLLESITKSALSNMWKEIRKVEPVALLHVALGNISFISKLYNSIGDNQRADFFDKDFTLDKNRKAALKNAYSSLSRQNYLMSAALFLIGNDIQSAINVIKDRLNEPLLAFLVVRLYQKSVHGDCMKWFLENAKWPDPILKVLVMNLISPMKTHILLKELLLEKDLTSHITSIGDRRSHMYLIYFKLTNDISVLSNIIDSMINDGLVPLAEYIRQIPELSCQSIKPVNIDSENSPLLISQSDDSSENHEFDFGGINSDWSDDYSDADQHENNDLVESGESNNTDFVRNLFYQYQIHRIKSLCTIFSGKCITNEECLNFVMHFGFHSLTRKYSMNNDSNPIIQYCSLLIEFLSLSYFESNYLPIKIKRLRLLISFLGSFECNDSCIYEFNLKKIKELKNPSIKSSLFLGLFTISLWALNPDLMAQLLSEVQPNGSKSNSYSKSYSNFDIDISSPRFPDSIPSLLLTFTSTNSFMSSIDLARYLVLLMIFHILKKIIQEINQNGQILWYSKLEARYKTIKKVVEFYFIKNGGVIPSINGFNDLNSKSIGLYDLIIKEFICCEKMLQEMVSKIKTKWKCLGVNFSLRMDLNKIDEITISNSISKIIINSIDSKQIAYCNENSVYLMSISNPFKSFEISFPDLLDIIPHPHFSLIMVLCKYNVALIGFDGSLHDDSFIVDQNNPNICASFSPNGKKLAICSTELCIFAFDLSKAKKVIHYSRTLIGKPMCVTWINNDTKLAISISYNSKSHIEIIDTIAGHSNSVSINIDWGLPTHIGIDYDKKYLILGTSYGYTSVFLFEKKFDLICSYEIGAPIRALALNKGIFAVCTEGGMVNIFSTDSLTNYKTESIEPKLTSLAISENYIISSSEHLLTIWKLN